MINKKNLKQHFDNFLVKKLFSENCYEKFYIRNKVLDTNSIFYNYKKNFQSGFSKFIEIYTYSHIYNNKFTFNSFLNKKIAKPKFLLKNFYDSLLILKKSKKKFFLLLKPIKGGFLSYFSGVVSFIKFKLIFYLIKNLFSKIKKDSFFLLIYLFISINKTLKCFRLYGDILKLKLILYSKRKNFSKVKKIKSRHFFFNFVFFKKQKQIFKKSYDNKNKNFKKKNKTNFISA